MTSQPIVNQKQKFVFSNILLQLLFLSFNDDFTISKSILQIENLILSDKTNIFGDLGKLFMPL